MRLLLAFALLIPTACFAIGADSQEYVGISQDGEKITWISFVSDPQEWTGGNWIYGSKQDSRFRYCWNNGVLSDPEHQWSDRISTHFVCTSKKGAKPSVWYKDGKYNYVKKSGIRYKEAKAYYEKIMRRQAHDGSHDPDEDVMSDYYVCDKGCDGTKPLFIFLVSHAGC